MIITLTNERPSRDILDQSELELATNTKVNVAKQNRFLGLTAEWRSGATGVRYSSAAQLGELLPGDINARRPWEAVSQ